MDTKKEVFSTSVNLPVESLLTVIDVDDKNVEVDVEKAMKKLRSGNCDSIRSMNTQFDVVKSRNETWNNPIPEKVNLTNDIFNITRIDRRKIERTNELKFFKAAIEFSTGKTMEFIIPSYVKLFSYTRGIFVPIEYVRNRDILIDYTGNIAKIADAELVEDFQMTDFYNINVAYDQVKLDIVEGTPEEEVRKKINESYNFYLNGVLANISYNNFKKKAVD